jgi:hypothetical protein
VASVRHMGLDARRGTALVVVASHVRAFGRGLEDCRLYVGARKDGSGPGIVSYSGKGGRFALGMPS